MGGPSQVFKKVLGQGDIGIADNFFELGGHSLLAARLVGELIDTYGISLTVTDLYANPTVQDLSHFLAPKEGGTRKSTLGMPLDAPPRVGKVDIAIIGVAGKFPGALDVPAFWENLQKGKDTCTYLDKEFLRKQGVSSELYNHPSWVPAVQMVEGADKFDAAFFGLSKTEATLMDPQHRLFMEVHFLYDFYYVMFTFFVRKCREILNFSVITV